VVQQVFRDHRAQGGVFAAARFLGAAEADLSRSRVRAAHGLRAGGVSRSANCSPSCCRERSGHKIEIAAPQRGEKRSLVDLVCQNAKQSYDQRFRVLQPP
jgi:hypothetical protein